MILLNLFLAPILNSNPTAGQGSFEFLQILKDIIIPTAALIVSVFVYLIY